MITAHIRRVQELGLLLSNHIIEVYGDVEQAREIAIATLTHDIEKYSEPAFSDLWQDEPGFKEALRVHRINVAHHPEYWETRSMGGERKQMVRRKIAEMICDWYSRCEEYGKDYDDWLENFVPERWKFSEEEKTQITYYSNLLRNAIKKEAYKPKPKPKRKKV